MEPERYELRARPAYHFEVDRREFFKFLGAGILVVCALKECTRRNLVPSNGGLAKNFPREIGGWLHIGENGVVTVYTGKVEVGQNIRTSFSQAVAEELLVGSGQNPNGHGGHATYSLRYGDVRKSDYADHESSTQESGFGCSRVC